jgi:hypothetical protein
MHQPSPEYLPKTEFCHLSRPGRKEGGREERKEKRRE